MSLQRWQWWKAARQTLGHHLVDPLRLEKVPQPVFTEVLEYDVDWQAVTSQLPGGLGQQDLAPMGDREHPAESVESGNLVVLALGVGSSLAGVQRHAHPDWVRELPRLSDERAAPRWRRQARPAPWRRRPESRPRPARTGNRRERKLPYRGVPGAARPRTASPRHP